MAEGLFTGKEVEFADGEKRFIRPLTISQLRKFVKVIDGMDTNATTLKDEDIDKMTDAVSIVLSKAYPEIAEDKEKIEDMIDLSCFQTILSIAMGTDPNG